jgi:glycosyltransferase involved in cell wall biosynthesis
LKTISLLHPFSAQAIGLSVEDILLSHSKPQVFALKNIMNAADIKVTIDYFTGSLFRSSKTIGGVEKRFWPISYPIFRKRHQWRNQYSKSHFNFVAKQTPDLTIINMSGHGSKYVFKLAKLLREKQKPYIAMIGGMNMSYTREALEYYKNAHHIIVHTHYQKGIIVQKEIFSSFDIRVLPLGIDTSVFKPKEENELLNNGRLLFVGRISRLKQIEIAIKTVHYLQTHNFSNAELTIIGPISDLEYYNELKELVLALKVSEQVTFFGSIQHSALIYHYQKADLLLLPSQHESFGMVMTEAMGCGIPVVALKGSGGPDDIITDTIDGLLCSPENYSETVFNLFNNKELFREMKLNARKKAEEKYSIEETIRVLNHSINSVFCE